MVGIARLMLADGRLPSGQHSHSGGLEVAIRRGEVQSEDDVVQYARGRCATLGYVDAAIAAWVVGALDRLGPAGVPWIELDRHVSARMPSPVMRETSRMLGGQLLHTASRVWPSPTLRCLPVGHPSEPHHSVVLGLTAVAAGLSMFDAALSALYSCVTTVTTAAVRLLGLDPLSLHRSVAAMGHEIEGLASTATSIGGRRLQELPGSSAPACELGAEEHARLDRRLFAS